MTQDQFSPGDIVRSSCTPESLAGVYRLVRPITDGLGDWHLSRDLSGTAGDDWDLLAHVQTFTKAGLYKIHPDRLDAFRAKIATLNKRAARLNVPTVDLSIGGLNTRLRTEVDPDTGRTITRVIAWHDAVMSIAPIGLAGWSFVATLDHTSEAGVILRPVPGTTVPIGYRDASPICDHCGYSRQRKETFVLRHDDGTYKQVGRQCVRDFLGTDPTIAARTAEYAIAFGELLAGEDDYAREGRPSGFVGLSEFMTATAVAIRLDGWTSRAKAREFGYMATADQAAYLMNPGRPDPRSAAERAAAKPTDADRALADSAIEWARDLRADGAELTDYQHNLCVVASGEAIGPKSTGIAASMIPAYKRAIGDALERQRAAVSGHVGTVGKRAIFGPLTVLRTREIAGNYGVTTICVLVDAAGNRLKWFASRAPEFTIGDTVTIKATVKEHGEYKGIKETTITRAALEAPPIKATAAA